MRRAAGRGRSAAGETDLFRARMRLSLQEKLWEFYQERVAIPAEEQATARRAALDICAELRIFPARQAARHASPRDVPQRQPL